jgi:hypothetical protein
MRLTHRPEKDEEELIKLLGMEACEAVTRSPAFID